MALIMAFSYDSRPVQTIVNQIKNVNKRDGIDLRPAYQRGYIWGNEFKDKLIFSIVKGYPIGNISLRVRTDKNIKGATMEVVDGQQRLTTISRFINGEYDLQGEFARKTIEYIVEYMAEETDSRLEKLKRRLNNKGKLTLKYSQLPESIQENINAFNISITNITNASDDEITEYFRFLQNQERLRAGEIINSLPESMLEKYINKIKNKDRFFRIFSFANDRRQFDRVFYSIIGLLDGKISFGVVDKIVLKYASECDELTPLAKKRSQVLLNQINTITEFLDLPVNYLNANARLMKFFLLLSSLNLVDFTIDTKKKLNAIDTINKKLSAFSSAKADSVEKTFYGYSNEVIEEFRLIALISKGGHSYKRVLNRMEILAYYINDFENKTIPSGIIPM